MWPMKLRKSTWRGSPSASLADAFTLQIWTKIKDDTDPKCWVVFGCDPDNKKKMKIISSGRCGLDRVHKHLTDDQVG